MNNESMEKIKALVIDEAFGEEIKDVESLEELQKAFEAHNVEISLDDLEQICVGIALNNSDSLNEEDLDLVSGGMGPLTALAITWGVCYVTGYVAGRIIKRKYKVCR